MRFKIFIAVLFVTLCMMGCKEQPTFSKSISIDGTWSYSNELVFPFQISDTETYYDLILGLTYGSDFGYQNIYVKITTKYPDGNEVEDILSLNLTDGAGTFLGNCSSSKCDIDILLQEKFKFRSSGDYTITIIQNGREEHLDKVFAAELKLYKVKE